MTTANKLIGAIAALVLVVNVGFAFVHSPTQPDVQPVAGAVLAPVNDLRQLVTWFTQTVYFGSAQQMSIDTSGNIVTTGTITSAAGTTTATSGSVNGVTTTFYRNSAMTAATTTPCVLGPITATSTIESLVANITAGTTTASTLTYATSTTPYATTSVIAQKTVAANAQVTFDWHPAANNSVVSPGNYIVLGQQGGIGTFSNTGTCNAVVRSVN